MRDGRFVKHLLYRRRLLAAAILTAAIGAAALHLNHNLEPGCTPVGGERIVSLPLAELGTGTARTFCYRDPGGNVIRFIVARDSDGTIHSAFDACRNCFEHNLGYRLSGAQMVCRFCGNRYPLREMGTGIASCVPIRLPHLALPDAVQIRVADLEAGGRLFPR
ncbi:MAG: Fe-S-containing protein [Candidatus Binataceae bacterium]|jgi:uncharacterized membrane protein